MRATFQRLMYRAARRVLGGTADYMRHSLAGAPLAYRPGHFYSPITAPAEVLRDWRDPDAQDTPATLADIALTVADSQRVWDGWADLLVAPSPALHPALRRRYHADNRHYATGDALVYSCMLRQLRPARLMEIGSGFSSALALDVIEAEGGTWPSLTFVEPYPALLESLLLPGDRERLRIIDRGVQQVPLEEFDVLESGDILFIDSTHVVKTGSDVVHELTRILPRLKSGVIVHFHDIFWPFEYPRDWAVTRNFSWNEAYALRAFLAFNSAWRILFFADHLRRFGDASVQAMLERTDGTLGAGLWLVRAA